MKEFFKRAIKSGRLAHGYLFLGPEDPPAGGGKKDTAFWLADFLKTNPFDILYISPKQGKKDISIEQIRKAKKHLSLSAYNSFYKFAIIDRAETMNLSACNALLKTLEEPSGNTILILITSKPDFLPKTIISRLQEVRFKSIPLDKISKDFIKQEYIDILKKPLNDIFKHIEKIYKQEPEISALLDSWLFWFRDKMKQDAKYVKTLKEIQKTKYLIETTNINKRLALENLVLCIKN
jgi:DNA polymerase-3 subunit delta'